jgi:signal transduction histidine kinase
MKEFLKRAGYTVLSAADYDSAAAVGVNGLDVAVIDVNLSGKSGIELLGRFHEAELYVPVIMITGEPNLSLIPQIVRAGAYDFIAKPIVKEVLLNAVARALEKKRLIDEKRRLEREIKRHAEELETRVVERTAQLVEAHQRLAHQEKIAALGRVAAQVAHEVKNPLAGLLLYSLHLKGKVSDKLSESEVSLIDKIVETINHLTKTVEQVLSFARPVSLMPRRMDLNRIASDVLQLLEPQMAANRIEVRLSLSEPDASGVLDESSLRAALMNLMLNAIQAMPDGGSLSVVTEQTGDALRLEIADTGVGMSEEQAKSIFEPFYTTKPQGLGLGVPFAKKVVEQHGGTISFVSRPGAGTTIRIKLPAKPEGS